LRRIDYAAGAADTNVNEFNVEEHLTAGASFAVPQLVAATLLHRGEARVQPMMMVLEITGETQKNCMQRAMHSTS